jgi:hypothetical protein
MTEVVGNPNQWDVFVYWVYGAGILLLGGYALYLIRLNKRLKDQVEERP